MNNNELGKICGWTKYYKQHYNVNECLHCHLVFGRIADHSLCVCECNITRCRSVALVVCNNLHLAVLENTDTRIGCAQVDANSGCCTCRRCHSHKSLLNFTEELGWKLYGTGTGSVVCDVHECRFQSSSLVRSLLDHVDTPHCYRNSILKFSVWDTGFYIFPCFLDLSAVHCVELFSTFLWPCQHKFNVLLRVCKRWLIVLDHSGTFPSSLSVLLKGRPQ